RSRRRRSSRPSSAPAQFPSRAAGRPVITSGLGGFVLGGGELGVASTSMTTETTMPPGLMVSWQPTHTPPPVRGTARPRRLPVTLTLTVVLWPASRRPELGVTDSWPIKPEDSVTDHDTGPPEAVSVRLAPDSALTTIALGATWSVPGGGGGGGAVVLLAGGDGVWLGDGLWLGDGPWLDGRAEGAGEEPPAGAVPPAAAEGDTPPAALAVAPAELPGLPGLAELPGVPGPPAPPGGLADAVPPDEPGPAPADDVPWLSALSWSWCVPNAPVTAKMTSTAAATTTAAAAAPCTVR